MKSYSKLRHIQEANLILERRHFNNKQKTSFLLNEEIKTVKDDPYAYKREGVNYYYANVGRNVQPDGNTKWIQITNDEKIRDIEKRIFGNQSGNYLQQGNSIDPKPNSYKHGGGQKFCSNKFDSGVIQLIFQGNLGTPYPVGTQIYISGYTKNPGAKMINGFTKVIKSDVGDRKSTGYINIDRPWPSSIKGIQDECAQVYLVNNNIASNAKSCGWGNNVDGYIKSGYSCEKDEKGNPLNYNDPNTKAKLCGYQTAEEYQKSGFFCAAQLNTLGKTDPPSREQVKFLQFTLLNFTGTSDVVLTKDVAGCKTDENKCDGILGPKTKQAIQTFQTLNGLEGTGTLDAQTSTKIKELFQQLKKSTAPPPKQEPQKQNYSNNTATGDMSGMES